MEKYKKEHRIGSFLLLLLILFSVIIGSVSLTFADDAPKDDTGGAVGGDPTNSKASKWQHAAGSPWNGSGTTDAWKTFVRKSNKRSEQGLINTINNLKYPAGFNGDDLATSCQKSEYIWWYGNGKGNFFTLAGPTHNLVKDGDPVSPDALDSFERYKNSAHGRAHWGGDPGVIIVCSASYEDSKAPITLQAEKDSFQYDGNPHTVSGWKLVKGQLKSGHRVKATASRTEINPDVYEVKFSEANVFDRNDNNVNDQYSDIIELPGELIIWEVPPPDEKVDEEGFWRCIDMQNDSATAYTKNATSGSHVITPGGYLQSGFDEVTTPAGHHALGGITLPRHRAPLSSWQSWKSTFQNGSRDNISPELNLEAMGVSEMLSEHGGVYDITKTLTEETYEAVHCQPQTRREIRRCRSFVRSDGSRSRSCWTELTPWENSGGRIVWSTSGPRTNYDYFSYQLLAVNCNKEGFQRAVSQAGGNTSITIGNADGSGFLETPLISGRNAGRLGKSGETSRYSFYTDGTSCQVFTCVNDVLSSSQHDAKNNIRENPLFTEEFKELSITEHNRTNEDNELVFFRDNNDRTVRADVWYVRNTGLRDLMSRPTENAKDTVANLYGGTPELDITTIHPLGYPNGRLTSHGLTNWNGHHNKFNVRSQWASDDGKPYELGLAWRYKADWANEVAGRADGDKVTGTSRTFSGEFDAVCEFKNENSNIAKAQIPNTPHVNRILPNRNIIWDEEEALRVLFTRSVTNEKR